MTIDREQKADAIQQKVDAIQSYFKGMQKLNYFRAEDKGKAQLNLSQLNKDINAVAIKLENSKRLLSILDSSRASRLNNASISSIFAKGLIFDIKDLQRHIISFQKKLTADEFGLRDFLIYSLVVIFLLSTILLICLSQFLDIGVSLLIAFLFYIFLTIKASRIRIENSLKKQKQEQQRKYRQDICDLENEYEQVEKKIISLQIFLDDSSFNYIKSLENEVERYLQEDLELLVKSAKEALNLRDSNDSESSFSSAKLLEHRPIVSFTGKSSSGAQNSSVIITDRGLGLKVEDKESDIYIHPEDYYKEKGMDERIRYSVYEFVAIFLCDNILSYYRCYWNFLKRTSVDKETCEYLYDSIVSIKTQDKSSLRLKDPTIKRTYRHLLSITTMDGKVLYLKWAKDRKEQVLSALPREYISDIDSAAQSIRYWIRQRKVDRIRVEDINRIRTEGKESEVGNYRKL